MSTAAPEAADAPSRSRRFLFSAIAVLILAVLLELGSIAVLLVAGGKFFSPASAKDEREVVLRHASRRSNTAGSVPVDQPAEGPEAEEARRDWPPEVVHPFLGFVRDPTAEGARFELNSLGFFDSKPPGGPDADHLVVGIFGGSVAVGLSRSRRLAEVLEASPKLAGKRVWIRSFALGGYKQPQQLIALNYALALGERLDVVVNLDGFNDIALAPREHEASGLNPVYPRRWTRRVADVPNVESQRLIGEIAFLEARRADRARWCSGLPLSLSPSCHLSWKVVDSRAAKQLASLRGALSEQRSIQRPYLTLGPHREYASDQELMGELVDLWGRSSLQMHQVAAAQGIHYVHFLQPNQYVLGSKPLSRAEKRKAFNPDHPWGVIVPQGYSLLVEEGEWLKAKGVPFHDLRMVFAGVDDTLYIDTCCHFNHKGMNRVASAIARAVLDEL